MSYRRALLVRWSRRDRLAVLVVALTVAFLVGTVLVVVAAGGQTAAIATEYDVTGTATYYDSTENANEAASPDAVVLPVAEVTDPDGDRTYAVGVQPDVEVVIDDRRLTPGSTTRGDVAETQTHRLRGESTVTADITARGPSIVPPEWYVTTPETVAQLGPTGAIVLEPSGDIDRADAPLQSALPFFLAGTDQALGVVWLLALGGGLLVAVIVYSTTRMTVADRRETICIVRATGATPRDIYVLFATRATLIGGLGIALGYAVGVIATNVAVNVAVALGLPTSLEVQVTPAVARVLIPTLLGFFVLTAVAGALAVRPAVERPPATIRSTASPSETASTLPVDLPPALQPRVLELRVIIPMTATLAAFVVFALVFAAAAGAVAPLAETDSATVSEPDAIHPVASEVPTAYGDALRARDIDASEEILLFTVHDGEPLPARGADYQRFARLSDAELVEGRAPEARDEAVVGTGATALDDVEVGEKILVGGSTSAGLTRVEVVGRYAAPGPDGAQLLVSLPTARHLSGVDDESVHVVRAERLPEPTAKDDDGDADDLAVTDVSIPEHVVADRSFEVTVTLANEGATATSGSVPVSFGDQHDAIEVELDAAERTNETVTFDAAAESETLTVGDEEHDVQVVPEDALTIGTVPEEVPPGETLVLQVVDIDGEPVADVDVHVRADGTDTNGTTDQDGHARLSFDEPGTYTIVAGYDEADNDTATNATISVTPEADRDLQTSFAVSPDDPDVFARPNAMLEVANPWTDARTADVTIGGPGGETSETVTLEPGERTTIERQFERRPAGEYTVTARIDGAVVAEHEYEVTGDDRLASAIATTGRAESTPLGETIAVAFGNLQVVVSVLVGLAGFMTVGATTAAVAGAVHARRRTLTIHRAVGGGPAGILRLVLGDALRMGAVATGLALGIAGAVLWAFDAAGLLVVFGVRLIPELDPWLVAGIALAALGVALVSAALATLGVIAATPAQLLRGDRPSDENGGAFDG